jgi:hypothetical protein
MNTNETIWLVISRDRGVLAACKNEATAEATAIEWELNERMGGGSPSIWVKEIELV